MTSALSLEATPDIQTWVQDHLVQLRRGDTTIEGVAIRYFSGKHRRVFECDLLPGKVLKLEGSIGLTSTLTKMTDSALIAKSLRHCVVPEVSKTEFDAYTLWVEEKLTGTYDPQAAAEKTEREFELCESDPELKELWISRFRDAAQMIVKTDYYDVDWRNVLLMDDGRLGFVDFESVMAEGSKTETGGGLYRLLHEMAPPFAFEAILEVVAEHKLQPFLFTYRGQRHPGPPLPYEEELSQLHATRSRILAENSSLRAYYDSKGITRDTPIREDLSEPDSFELKVIKILNEGLRSPYRSKSDLLRISRCIQIQDWNFTRDPAEYSLSYQERTLKEEERHRNLEQALTSLAEKGLIAFCAGNLASARSAYRYEVYC